MLPVILNRLANQAEQMLEEEHAGFTSQRRSTTEQIFNLSPLVEIHLKHEKELFHSFIELKKAFDRVWQLEHDKDVRRFRL